jgi:osmoprotectant transport system permease protein
VLTDTEWRVAQEVTVFLSQYGSEIVLRTGEHVLLVAIAMLCACAIGIPVGVLLTRVPKLAPPILGLANILQTIPSLALFGILISVPFLGGIGQVPAIVALALYALLPLIRNTYIGIQNVDPAIREAARGMGMTHLQRLFRVEMPLAMGVILSGVRVATVISVGMATIAAAIGGGGLGVLIFRGIATVNNQLIWAGAIPSAGLAVLADFGLGVLEYQLTRKPQRRQKSAIAIAVLLTLLSLLGVLVTHWAAPETIAIGSKNFTEQVILGELLAQQIEAKTNLRVDRRFNLGGTLICHEAVKAGKIAGYVEYTGTALTAILKQPVNPDPQHVYAQVKQAYQQRFKLDVFPSLGFNNTFALIIRGDEAKRLGIKTLSEAAPYTANWQAGFGPEFLERQDGYPGLAKTYGFRFTKPPKQMELGLMYPALREKQVDIIAANSTDGLISALNLVILADDKAYFPPYEAVPVFNAAILRQHPELGAAIQELAGAISTAAMQQLNYQIDQQGRPVEDVVKAWLKSKS